ncbi:serine/threonine protein kinase, partial [Bacillus sp. S34]|nr:serine/threonine protein kinase [Bacillus sp. S34]
MVVVAALAIATVVVVGRLGSGAIPVVSDVQAASTASSVTFTWDDPGLRNGDTYVISSNGAASQQTGARFVVSGKKGDEEC